jgi:hypothetical protein
MWVGAKFGTCTVVNVNGVLVEYKMCTFTLESTHLIFNKCLIYTHDCASVKFSTNLRETDYSVENTSLVHMCIYLRCCWIKVNQIASPAYVLYRTPISHDIFVGNNFVNFCISNYAWTIFTEFFFQATYLQPLLVFFTWQQLFTNFCRNNFVNFDPAFWKCEGAQAKIVVYYPRNE